MIKPYFIIRSKRKLFWGLSFTISGFILIYTILTLIVLPEIIPWKRFISFNKINTTSKYMLLILPILSIFMCIILYFNAKHQKLPRLFNNKFPSNTESAKKQLRYYDNMMTGNSFLCSMLLAFWQIDRLNIAKKSNRFSPLILILLIAALICYTIYITIKIFQIK